MPHGDTDEGERMLDTRDLIARFEELESEREDLQTEFDDADADVTLASHGGGDVSGELVEARDNAEKALAEWDADNGEEFKAIESFLDEMKGYGGDEQWRGDWYPVTLIREDIFPEYAEELAEDLHGDAVRDAQWPFDCIDWEKAADRLRIDYGSATYGTTEYLYR